MIDLLAELRAILERLDKEQVPYALCGGIAMAIHGYPRATVDIDLLVPPENLPGVLEAVRPLGFDIPANPMSFRGGTVEIRRISKVRPGEPVLCLDILLVTPTLQEAWKSRLKMTWDFGTISVVSREGLIALKMLRGSGRDQDDIKQLRGEET
jgi:hypothetical protein